MYYVLIAWKIEFVYSKYWFNFCSYRNFDTSLFICLIIIIIYNNNIP